MGDRGQSGPPGSEVSASREWRVPWICPRSGDTLEIVVYAEKAEAKVRGLLCPACGHDHSLPIDGLLHNLGVGGRRTVLRKVGR